MLINKHPVYLSTGESSGVFFSLGSALEAGNYNKSTLGLGVTFRFEIDKMPI
jgi:hypothetical protein